MYLSAEKVTDRRLSNNKTNYSISVAVLVAIAVVWKWTITNNVYFFCGILLVFILALFAVFFCSLWIGQIKDFKNLNKAKFEVVNEMAANLRFDSVHDVNIDLKSYEPFKEEWSKLKAIKALQQNSNNNIIALKSTNMEFFIPKALRIVFCLIVAGAILTVLFNLPETWVSIKLLLKVN